MPFNKIMMKIWDQIISNFGILIELLHVLRLSLIEFQKKRVLEYQSNVNSLFDKLNAMIELSKKSLKVDVENINKNHFSCVVGKILYY